MLGPEGSGFLKIVSDYFPKPTHYFPKAKAFRQEEAFSALKSTTRRSRRATWQHRKNWSFFFTPSGGARRCLYRWAAGYVFF